MHQLLLLILFCRALRQYDEILKQTIIYNTYAITVYKLIYIT